MFNTTSGAARTTKISDEVEFIKNALKCVSAGTDSYFTSATYVSYAKEFMDDMKTMGSWDSHISYDKWIKNLYSMLQKERVK